MKSKFPAFALAVGAAVTVLVACGPSEGCDRNEVESEDYGCIERDDLDLNSDGSFEDEEREWDKEDD